MSRPSCGRAAELGSVARLHVLFRALIALALGGLTSCHPIPENATGVNLFPLFRYAEYEDQEAWELDVLWPLSHISRHEGHSRTWFFPIFFSSKTFDADDWTLVPLFGVRKRAHATHYDVVPFLIDSAASVTIHDEEGFSGLRLLFNEVRKVPGGTRVALLELPGIFHGLEIDTGRVGFKRGPQDVDPAFSVSLGKVLEIVEVLRISDEGAWDDVTFLELFGSETLSLFRYHRRHDEGPQRGDGETHLFPFYYSGRDEGGAKGYWHLWPLYGQSWREPDFRKHYFAYPLFSVQSEPSVDASGFEVLWPLFDYEREERKKTLTFFGFLPWTFGESEPDVGDDGGQ